MGWNGSGTFTRSYDWTNERDAGYKIDAAKFDTENDNFADGINACRAKNGENAATGDLPMGGYKHTGVGDGTALTHYASIKQAQNGSLLTGISGGSANVQTLSLSPAPEAYYNGMVINFIAGFSNTGPCTLNVNGLGALNIRHNGTSTVGGEIKANRGYTVIAVGSIGTYLEIVNDIKSGCRVTRTANQSFGSGVTANVTFPTETYDPDALHSTSTNTDRISLPIVGLWVVSGQIYLDGSTAGYTKYLRLKTAGSSTFAETASGDDGETMITVTGVVYATSVSDYAVMEYNNNDPSARNINPAYLSAAFVR